MAELTPEERQRIYEEEKARIEARVQIEGQLAVKPKKKPLGCGAFILILAGLVAVALILAEIMRSYDRPTYRTKNTAPTAAPIITAPPLSLKTNKFSVDAYGYYEVVGEVQNVSSKTFRFVEIKAEFLNAAGAVVGTDMTYACAEDYILPGGKKSFKMMGTNQSDYKRVRVVVDDYSEVR